MNDFLANNSVSFALDDMTLYKSNIKPAINMTLKLVAVDEEFVLKKLYSALRGYNTYFAILKLDALSRVNLATQYCLYTKFQVFDVFFIIVFY